MRMTVRRFAGRTAALVMAAIVLTCSGAAAESSSLVSPKVKLRVSSSRPGSGASLRLLPVPPAVWFAPEATPVSVLAVHASMVPATEKTAESERIVSVVLRVGGRRARRLLTNAESVADLLGEMRVRVGRRDIIRPALGRTLRQGTSIQVVQNRTKRERDWVSLPFGTEVEYSSSLEQGEATVESAGSPGRAVRTYRAVYRNGKLKSRKLLSERIVVDPVARVVVRGTQAPTPSLPSPSGGVEYGEAVFYDTHGMVAAHKTLPFGTVVTVTNLDNGRSVTVVINDRGPYGPGRIIDLSPEAFSVIAPLSQGVVRARITW